MFDITNWFWVVGQDNSKVWSSAAAGFVPTTDTSYLNWSASNIATNITTLDNLKSVLLAHYPAGWTPQPVTSIEPLTYFNRFNPAETLAIHTAALASPPTTESLALFNYLLQASAAKLIDLTDPILIAGHEFLVAGGLLTTQRNDKILAPRTDGT